MRTRLIRTMVLLALGAVVVAGVVTLLLSVRSGAGGEETSLRRQATSEVRSLEAKAGATTAVARLERLLTRVQGHHGPDVEIYRRLGDHLYPPSNGVEISSLHDGIPVSALHPAQLAASHTVSGRRGRLVFAAVPFTVDLASVGVQFHGVVVFAEVAHGGLPSVVPLLIGAALVVIVAAVILADRVSRRILRPLNEAKIVTARIAAGDLSARAHVPDDADDELAQLGASINSMAEELGTARQAQRQFFLSVSHDLRTPLTSIRGFAEGLEDGTVTDPVRAGMVIASEAKRLERLVGDLLELGRIELRQFSLRPEPVALGAAVVAAAAGFEPQAGEFGVRVEVDVTWSRSGERPEVGVAAADDSMVLADPDRLSQVLANLLENAIDHARSVVRVRCDGQEVTVEDDGPGIAPDAIATVWEPYVGSERKRPRRIGSGLGLAIVDELMRSMRGNVTVVSPLGPDGGTRMVLRLPPVGRG